MAKKPVANAMQVSIAADDLKKLSTAQKQFNSLIKKIDSKKKLLQEWQETLPVYQAKYDGEYLPLMTAMNQHKMQFVILLDQHYGNPLFKKNDKRKLKHLIVSVCESLFDGSDETEQLKTIFNRYSDDDYDTLLKNTHEDIEMVMKGFAKELFDIEVDHDVDLSSPEAFQAHIKEKLDQRQAQQAADAESVKPRKKTKRQLEKELRLQEEEALASKSIQEVYRKLVAVLHPDREPDEQERQRKTELMQKVNNAYDKKDLLKLLELQLEIEQIDLAHLGAIADTRLKHFNKILKEQLSELEENLTGIEHMVISLNYSMPYFGPPTPKQLLKSLDKDIREIQQDIKHIQLDIEQFQNPAELKIWLKAYRIPKASQYDEFDNMLNLLDFGFRR